MVLHNLVLLTFITAAGCANRVAGDEVADSGSTKDAPGEVALDSGKEDARLRDDGCPVAPTGLSTPCVVGKVCKYYDACGGIGGSIMTFRCWAPPESPKTPTDWRSGSIPCSSERGPDGCPLSYPTLDPACTVEGQRCTYRACSDAGGGEIQTAVCKRTSSGALAYEKESVRACE